jgi:fumarate reductase subunit D
LGGNFSCVGTVNYWKIEIENNNFMKRPVEPLFWSLFGGGGTLAAFFLPVLLVVTGLAIPLGWVTVSYDTLNALVAPWYSRALVVVIISLSLFHWAHRFRFTLHEGLQLHPYDKSIAVFCYGSALLISGFAAVALLLQ